MSAPNSIQSVEVNQKSYIGMFIGIVAVVFLVIAFLWLPLPHAPGDFRISFLYVTNNPAGIKLGVFSITNTGNPTLWYEVCPPQVKSPDGWSRLEIPRGVGMKLPAHETGTFSVPIPMDGSAWRVPIVWNHSASGIMRFRGVVRYNLRSNWYLLRHHRRPVLSWTPETDAYVSYSKELAPTIN